MVIDIPETVYDPAEDSFLLAENVLVNPSEKVLEIGSGSGYVSIFLATKFPKAEFFCTDINFNAARITKKNAVKNGVQLEVICADLLTPLLTGRVIDQSRSNGKESNSKPPFFDVVLFNSPYLPVQEEGLLAKAWSGGEGGLEVVENFLMALPKVMKRRGRCFLVVSSKTSINSLMKIIRENENNLVVEEVDQLREGGEAIILIKVVFN